MVILIAAFIENKRVALAEFVAIVLLCVASGVAVGTWLVLVVVAVAALAKSFEWDALAHPVTAKSGDE